MQKSDMDELLDWAARLPDRRLLRIARLLDDPSDQPSDINQSFEPLLIEVEGDEAVFMTVDEGKGNLLIRPYSAVRASRPAVFGEYSPIEIDSQALFGSLSLDAFGIIKSVTVLSGNQDGLPPDYFSACGLKVRSQTGFEFAVGTHLTELRLAGLWVVPTSEVSAAIHEQGL